MNTLKKKIITALSEASIQELGVDCCYVVQLDEAIKIIEGIFDKLNSESFVLYGRSVSGTAHSIHNIPKDATVINTISDSVLYTIDNNEIIDQLPITDEEMEAFDEAAFAEFPQDKPYIDAATAAAEGLDVDIGAGKTVNLNKNQISDTETLKLSLQMREIKMAPGKITYLPEESELKIMPANSIAMIATLEDFAEKAKKALKGKPAIPFTLINVPLPTNSDFIFCVIAERLKELEALRKDAERYQFLRDSSRWNSGGKQFTDLAFNDFDEFDKIVDFQMKIEKEK